MNKNKSNVDWRHEYRFFESRKIKNKNKKNKNKKKVNDCFKL